jgi:hypothetical protein
MNFAASFNNEGSPHDAPDRGAAAAQDVKMGMAGAEA